MPGGQLDGRCSPLPVLGLAVPLVGVIYGAYHTAILATTAAMAGRFAVIFRPASWASSRCPAWGVPGLNGFVSSDVPDGIMDRIAQRHGPWLLLWRSRHDCRGVVSDHDASSGFFFRASGRRSTTASRVGDLSAGMVDAGRRSRRDLAGWASFRTVPETARPDLER